VVWACGGCGLPRTGHSRPLTTGKTFFTDAKSYLDNLRDSLIPLAIPLAAIGLTGGGVAYMVGNVMAQKILGGVVIGTALALMGPSLVA